MVTVSTFAIALAVAFLVADDGAGIPVGPVGGACFAFDTDP